MPDQSKIRFTLTGKILEFLSLVSIVGLILIPALYYNDLPAEIPSHFGFRGNPDAWSGKATIWTLPLIGFVLYAGLSALNYFLVMKGAWNEKQLKSQPIPREKILLLIQSLKLMLAIAFTYLVWMTIRVSGGHADGLGVWFLPTFIVFMTFMPIMFLLSSGNKK